MLDQFDSITQAADILIGTLGTPQERLAKGFKAFRRATIFSNDWPLELWEKYNGICDTLLAAGTWQKTIDQMDVTTACQCVTQVAQAMKELAAAVELARGHVATLPRTTTSASASEACGRSKGTPQKASSE